MQKKNEKQEKILKKNQDVAFISWLLKFSIIYYAQAFYKSIYSHHTCKRETRAFQAIYD